MKRSFLNIVMLLLGLMFSCKDAGQADRTNSTAGNGTASSQPEAVHVPDFNADTAYQYVAAQVAFGPRTPGSPAQQQCAAWMEEKLRAFCDTVYRQTTTITGGDKKQLPCINLIGAIHPAAKRRILLLAHWDSRPWADEDTKDKDKPILAADDGGSGAAVLLELARVLKITPLPADMGVDILLTDVEDYGISGSDDSYCLGTQYWATHPHVPGYTADYGILLDMVGGRDARFPMEQTSAQYAQDVEQRVCQAAQHAGASSYFPFTRSRGGVTDDHKYVNELAHIPTIDIISLTDATQSGFPAHWHTHNDNMQIIDKGTLQAVGQTLLQTLYEAAQPSV